MTLVIEILPASGSITSDDLDATIFGRIDSDVCPRWWNSQLPNSCQILLRNLTAIRAPVTKATPRRSGSQDAVRVNPLGCGHGKIEARD
jgi:hypothetical protein